MKAIARRRQRLYVPLPINEGIADRAREVQVRMAARGHHRTAGIIDLLTAAVAEHHVPIVLHYDGDFEHIAATTRQPHGSCLGAAWPDWPATWRSRILGGMTDKDTATATGLAPAPQVWPTLRARDATALIDFLVEAFGFEATAVMADGDHVGARRAGLARWRWHHARLRPR